ncbi:MAG: DNA primase [Flavobacteriales bacterium]|nr:MAG: DNA primase [Flavobacteriales bacterium]
MSFISEHTINEIRDYPLSKSFNGFVSLKKAGSVYKGLSPFTDEKSPSFIVSDAKGIWKCFSSGKSGKDLISFLIQKENLDFKSAVIKSAKELNINIKYEKETSEQKEKRKHKEVLQEIVDKTNKTYQNNFERLPNDHWAKKYMLDERGFKKETLETFDIGFAFPDSRLTPIIKNEAKLKDALELGIVKEDKNNPTAHYDFFRDRIIFPIYNNKTYCVGFGGRINPSNEKAKAKYLNSAESEIYNKQNVLYGYNLAKPNIPYFDYAILVEGYTDVMRMHEVGFDNTVASCGTALTVQQVKLLKKVTDKVVIFRDNDKAGQKATQRDIELLLQNGMIAEVVVPENDTDDPDTIGKKLGKETLSYLSSIIEDAILYNVKNDYNKFYNEAKVQQEKEIAEEKERTGKKPRKKKVILSPQNKRQFIENICKTLSLISDFIVKNQYIKEIVNRYKEVSLKEINDILNGIEEEKKPKTLNRWDYYDYELPDYVTCKLEDVIDDIKEYGIFQSNSKIFVLRGSASYYFEEISNFSIEIVQHMQDEVHPMKLIRLQNVNGVEKIFDVKSDLINSLQSFKNVITGHGNFFFSGSSSDHERLLKYLFDKMGNGRKIEILGWQPEGFWVWNNKIVVPGNREDILNKEGLFKYQKESYYIPSANSIYKNNLFKFKPQKKFKSIETSISHTQYFHQIFRVHRNHAITGILFGISSLYQDIVVDKTGFFPILFYFGPASTGKDNLSRAIRSMVGDPQSPIQLEGGASTIKAQIREFTQFNNGISELAEYKRGNPQLDGVLKGLWDRRGYKRGSIESKIATDEVPILSSAILTGNEFPDAEALITRLIWEEMKAQEFSDEEIEQYNILKDILKKGISGLSDFFIHKRLYVEEFFLDTYRANIKLLNDLPQFKNTTSRIISNLGVLLSFYQLFEKENFFPFGQSEIMKHFAYIVENQKKKLSSASPYIKFWDCFVMTMRGNVNDQLKVNQDIRIDGSHLMFNFKIAFMKIQRMWLSQYQESPPDQRRMKEILKDDASYIDDKKKVRVNKEGTPTSAFVVDMAKMGDIQDNIIHQMNIQLNQDTLFSEKNVNDNLNESTSKLPFY